MRFFHLNDPWALTLVQWEGLLRKTIDILDMENPPSATGDHRHRVERMVARAN
jgi:hypothetical protein